MVFVQTTVRVSRFAQDFPLSVTGDLGPTGVGVQLPGGGINIGVPGGPPFGFVPGGPVPFPIPGPPGKGQILKASIPRPVHPSMEVKIIMWFAAALGPAQYAMRIEIPQIGYAHTTPFIQLAGPGVFMLDNTFTMPSDAATGQLQGTIKLLKQDFTNQIMEEDNEPFVLQVEGGVVPPDGCPTGATKVNNVCVCTDTTKEIVGNACVAKCPTGQHRDPATGVCVLNIPGQPLPPPIVHPPPRPGPRPIIIPGPCDFYYGFGPEIQSWRGNTISVSDYRGRMTISSSGHVSMDSPRCGRKTFYIGGSGGSTAGAPGRPGLPGLPGLPGSSAGGGAGGGSSSASAAISRYRQVCDPNFCNRYPPTAQSQCRSIVAGICQQLRQQLINAGVSV